jgi:hypothetical protein
MSYEIKHKIGDVYYVINAAHHHHSVYDAEINGNLRSRGLPLDETHDPRSNDDDAKRWLEELIAEIAKKVA